MYKNIFAFVLRHKRIKGQAFAAKGVFCSDIALFDFFSLSVGGVARSGLLDAAGTFTEADRQRALDALSETEFKPSPPPAFMQMWNAEKTVS